MTSRLRLCGAAVVLATVAVGPVLAGSSQASADTSTEASATSSEVDCQIQPPADGFSAEVAGHDASAQVWRLYQSIYLRQPKRTGFDYWVGIRESGASMADIAQSFMAESIEFENRYGDVSDRQFVELVFNNVLCRDPAESGLDYWARRLQNSGNRSDVLLNFTELHEYMRTTGTCFSATGVPQNELDHCDPDYQDRLLEQSVIESTNQIRIEEGCDPLNPDPRLNRAALDHSTDMAENDYFDHFGLDGSNPGDRIARTGYDAAGWAENIAWGYRSADAVMTGWMDSPGHRSNIVNCNLREIGVGYHNNYWTQKFAIDR